MGQQNLFKTKRSVVVAHGDAIGAALDPALWTGLECTDRGAGLSLLVNRLSGDAINPIEACEMPEEVLHGRGARSVSSIESVITSSTAVPQGYWRHSASST